jgi:hypothetical protein
MPEHTEHILNASKPTNARIMEMMKSNVSNQNKFFVALLSLLFLALGISAAAYWGDLSMRPKDNVYNMKM